MYNDQLIMTSMMFLQSCLLMSTLKPDGNLSLSICSLVLRGNDDTGLFLLMLILYAYLVNYLLLNVYNVYNDTITTLYLTPGIVVYAAYRSGLILGG